MLFETIDPFDHFMREYIEQGDGPQFEVPSGKLHTAVREFLDDNDYGEIYNADRFIRNLRKRKRFGKKSARTGQKIAGVYTRHKVYTGIRLTKLV